LIEIVTNPVINSSNDAASYVDMIRIVAQTLNISDAQMVNRSLRANINISICKPVITRRKKLQFIIFILEK